MADAWYFVIYKEKFKKKVADLTILSILSISKSLFESKIKKKKKRRNPKSKKRLQNDDY